jgi:antitoxin component of MazEF toxin-antitoxin module
MNETYKLRTIGGALMVTIPQKIVRQEGLRAGDEVRIAVMVGHVITVKPQKAKGKSK